MYPRKRLYRDCPIQCCVLSTVVAALLQLTITLPMSLFVLLVHNWLLGNYRYYTQYNQVGEIVTVLQAR